MISGKFQLMRFAGLWVVTATTLCAGNFVAPAEGPVAFRRDKIPLDADTMAGLSRHLVTLARGLDGNTSVKRRAAAQMLALAATLDPGNTETRNVIAGFEAEKHRPQTDPEPLEKSRSRVWQCLAWLETPEAGSHGQALAACLTDVLVTSDPKDPRAGAALAKGERGAWKDWVAEVTAFEPAIVPETVVAEAQKQGETGIAGAGILLDRAQVFTVMWVRSTKGDGVTWEQKIAPLQMTARVFKTPDGEKPPFTISIGPQGGQGEFRELGAMLVTLLKTQSSPLPAGGRIVISSPSSALQPTSSRRQSISAAAAVLASAAVSGRVPDATIIGVVDETGAFKLPTGFWSQLQALGSGTGRRLILPAAAAEFLPCMLALEKPQLFLEHEILLASSFRELVALSAKIPDEPLAKSLASFQEIREKAGTQPVGQYVANSFVRRRLVDIGQATPSHFSAKMLAIQGAGNRPTYVTRAVLAAELKRAIEPMEWMMARENPTLNPTELDRLGSSYELCREQVDRLIRYASKDDRPLLDRVQDVVTGIRTMDRAARMRGDAYDLQSAILQSYTKLTEGYQNVVAELANAMGEAVPPPSE